MCHSPCVALIVDTRSVTRASLWLKSSLVRVVLALLLITVVTGAWGFLLLDHPAGPPPLPRDSLAGSFVWTADLRFDPVPNYLIGEQITACGLGEGACRETVTLTIGAQVEKGGRGRVVVDFAAVFTKTDELLCKAPLIEKPGKGCVTKSPVYLNSHGEASFTVRLRHGSTVRINDPYATVAVPAVNGLVRGTSGAVTKGRIYRSVDVSGEAQPYQLTMLQGPAPTITSRANGWDWNEHTNTGGEPVAFTATNPYKLAADTSGDFRGGILLGIGGSALAVLIVELARASPQRVRRRA